MKQKTLTEKDLLNLQDEDKTESVFREWCHNGEPAGQGEDIHTVIKRLTVRGIARYSLQLVVVEVAQIVSIYMIRVIINYLQNVGSEEYPWWYSYALFVAFCLFRFIAIAMRNYYDLHVYNYFKYVENAIKAWLYSDVQKIKLWQMTENKRAGISNILTKDIDAFVNGSWQFPYLVVVPINTLISIVILQSMVIYLFIIHWI